jgi:hypothetical protein
MSKFHTYKSIYYAYFPHTKVLLHIIRYNSISNRRPEFFEEFLQTWKTTVNTFYLEFFLITNMYTNRMSYHGQQQQQCIKGSIRSARDQAIGLHLLRLRRSSAAIIVPVPLKRGWASSRDPREMPHLAAPPYFRARCYAAPFVCCRRPPLQLAIPEPATNRSVRTISAFQISDSRIRNRWAAPDAKLQAKSQPWSELPPKA